MAEVAVIEKKENMNYYIPLDVVIPQEDGEYVLKVRVEDGVVTYSFE